MAWKCTGACEVGKGDDFDGDLYERRYYDLSYQQRSRKCSCVYDYGKCAKRKRTETGMGRGDESTGCAGLVYLVM